MNNVIVDYRISSGEKLILEQNGYNVILTSPCNNLYTAICGHPDVLICIIDKNTILVHKDTPVDFIEKLKNLNIKVIKSKNSLNEKYPFDIILNAVNLKNTFIHNLKFTDEFLYNEISKKLLINVNQGYTKCSTAVISENAIITSDSGIAAAAKENKIDVLFLPYGDIELNGFEYGFIGGTCGLLDNNTIAFYGNLEYYKFGKEVLTFIKKYNLTPLYLREGKLVDRGSILFF
ncbi:DUF6873 family GME fold protein [Clostridium hydrogenum]|uniref:DUF6873 family GME fold protein n=1 Tax=Clostridium hydrogenum TaxID=2855764 RepID=UPI001F41806D|nr:hypothetical protein [Clostridium hydrogenum]